MKALLITFCRVFDFLIKDLMITWSQIIEGILQVA